MSRCSEMVGDKRELIGRYGEGCRVEVIKRRCEEVEIEADNEAARINGEYEGRCIGENAHSAEKRGNVEIIWRHCHRNLLWRGDEEDVCGWRDTVGLRNRDPCSPIDCGFVF